MIPGGTYMIWKETNYRLNTDTKLYAKLLTQRLSMVIPQNILPDQVGFAPDRQASGRTRHFIDLIQWVKHGRMPSLPFSGGKEGIPSPLVLYGSGTSQIQAVKNRPC